MLYLIFRCTSHDYSYEGFDLSNWYHMPVDILNAVTAEKHHTWYSVVWVRESLQQAFEEDLKNQGFKEAPRLIPTLDHPLGEPFKLFDTI